MQSTGHTSTHERSFTLMHGSAMMYVIPALQWIHGRTANIVDWGPLESSAARALGCLPGDRRDGAPCQERQNDHQRSEEHTSELQSQSNLVCRLLLEKTNKTS